MTSDAPAEGSAVFRRYADFYDALYADKDYEAECDYLESIFRAHGLPSGAAILDLGSGTGGHDIPLGRRGYRVTGVDRSEQMVGIARGKAAEDALGVSFVVGDVRSARLERVFDAVISMFAVMSYQLTNEDLEAAFVTARAHLRAGGLFVFDGWFGPGVLTDPPKVVTKIVKTEMGDEVERIATPTLDAVAQTVSVAYEVVRRHDDEVERTSEVHTMRFLFAQEISLLLGSARFELVAFGPFMHLEQRAGTADWNFSAVAKAI